MKVICHIDENIRIISVGGEVKTYTSSIKLNTSGRQGTAVIITEEYLPYAITCWAWIISRIDTEPSLPSPTGIRSNEVTSTSCTISVIA